MRVVKRFRKPLAALAIFMLSAAAFAQETGGKPNPQMQAVLDELAALNPKPIETLSPAEARMQPSSADAVAQLMKKQEKTPPPGPAQRDEVIPGPGGQILVRIYTPPGNGPFPIVVYYHGGGFVIATPASRSPTKTTRV